MKRIASPRDRHPQFGGAWSSKRGDYKWRIIFIPYTHGAGAHNFRLVKEPANPRAINQDNVNVGWASRLAGDFYNAISGLARPNACRLDMKLMDNNRVAPVYCPQNQRRRDNKSDEKGDNI